MGQTALHIAARKGSDFLVKLLVERGANLALTNRDSKTAFDIAAENSRSELVAVLLFSGVFDIRSHIDRSASPSDDQFQMPPRKKLRVTQ